MKKTIAHTIVIQTIKPTEALDPDLIRQLVNGLKARQVEVIIGDLKAADLTLIAKDIASAKLATGLLKQHNIHCEEQTFSLGSRMSRTKSRPAI